MNKELLNEKLVESGKKLNYFSNVLGITNQTFKLKRDGRAEFTVAEASILAKELNLTKADKISIFLS